MSDKTNKRTPVNLIAGPLGVGKTTAINHLLRHRPEDERWAVLVNEYGLVGLDAALMEPTSEPGVPLGVEIREVAGGCICCSAAFVFEASLAILLRRRPDRLLIEPTGLATASGILDVLDRPGFRDAVDVRSVVCLLDPNRFQETIRREEVHDQVAAADVLLAGRADLATAEQLDAFQSWANSLQPAKRVVGRVEMGHIDPALLDLVAAQRKTASASAQRPETTAAHLEAHKYDSVVEKREAELRCDATRPIVQRFHHSRVASTIGWVCWDGLVFDAGRASSWFMEMAELPGARRFKAVLHTNEGWRSFNRADDIEEVRRVGERRDSRVEIVVEGAPPPDAGALEIELRECLVSPA